MQSPKKQKITIELPEKVSSNTFYRYHYQIRSRVQSDYYIVVNSAVKGVLEKVNEYPTKMMFDFEFKGRLLDVSNCASMVKMIEDGLIKAGIIEDDNAKYVNEICVRVTKNNDNKDLVNITIG